MSTSENTFAETTIVAFHIGRGGRFHNSGFKSFLGGKKITDFTYDLFISFENEADVHGAIGTRKNLSDFLQITLDNRDDSACVAAFERRTGLSLGELVYTDCNGSQVGLTLDQAGTGIGCINIDNDYDTTTCCYLSQCSQDELRLIFEYEGYISREIKDYAFENM